MARKTERDQARSAAPDPVADPPAGHAAEVEPQGPVENLDVGLDEDGGGDSYESLVAALAEMEDGRPAAAGNRRPSEPDAGPAEIHDLDEDDGRAGGIDRLIAEVGRGSPALRPPVEPEAELPIIDLDDDVPFAASGRSPADGASGTADLSRLARAAGAGASEEKEPPPIPLDLFADVSTPEARARLLAEALAHAEHKEARYRVPLADTRRAARWKSAAAAAMLLLAGIVAIAPPALVRPELPAGLGDEALEHGIRMALLLQAQQVEAYRVRTQQLPGSLDDLPMRLAGLRYTRSGRSYQLVGFTPGGDAIVYDAADPAPSFRMLLGSLMSHGRAP